jgi:hypothetical protein
MTSEWRIDGICKGATVVYWKHYFGISLFSRAGENHKTLIDENQWPRRNPNQAPPENTFWVLSLHKVVRFTYYRDVIQDCKQAASHNASQSLQFAPHSALWP